MVTGCNTDTGRGVVQQLRDAGHHVIGVDTSDADVSADLSSPPSRESAARAVLDRAQGRLDGAIVMTGVSVLAPMSPALDESAAIHAACQRVVDSQYSAIVGLLGALRPAFTAVPGARVTVCVPEAPGVLSAPESLIRMLLAGNISAALGQVSAQGLKSVQMIDAACRVALTRWVQREAISAEWGGKGIVLAAATPAQVVVGRAVSRPLDGWAAPWDADVTGGLGETDTRERWHTGAWAETAGAAKLW
jgi:NAD(P)-dependent dehydrogenase (short-subunit alcohol dehydrogenase family)